MDNCEKCGGELDLCPTDWPYNDDFWICLACGSISTSSKSDEERLSV